MVFALLPNRKADTYAAVKKLCCLDFDYKMPSQCVLYSTIRDKEKIVAVASKVYIKMPFRTVLTLTLLLGCDANELQAWRRSMDGQTASKEDYYYWYRYLP